MQLTWRYILALSVVAVLAGISQYFIYVILSKSENDSTVINMAGKQRMLSQKVTKEAMQALYLPEERDRMKAKAELRTTLDEWLTSHNALQSDNDSLQVAIFNDKDIEERYARIDSSLHVMHQSALVILEGDSAESNQALFVLMAHEGHFLAGMDSIVKAYEQTAKQHVASIRDIEMLLFFLTIIVLTIEGLFIFMPASNQIKLYLDELETQNTLLDVQNNILQQANKEAVDAAMSKTAFLSTMSHEIRAPMNGVIGMASLLMETPLDEEQSELVEIINGSGEHLLMLINDILDFSKIESGRLELDLHRFEIRQFMESVLLPFQTMVDSDHLVLESHIDPDIPSAFFGDSGRIRQILVNLVGNAKKFTESGSITVSVEQVDYEVSDVTRDTSHLKFSVADTGIGIPSEKIGQLFQSFTQADASTTRRYGGTGLGLAICKRLTELMGGAIWVDSIVGEGSTFHFTLPLHVMGVTEHMAV